MKKKIIVYEMDMRVQYQNGGTKRVVQFTTLKEIHTFIGDLIEHDIDIVKLDILRLDQKYVVEESK